MNKIEKRVVREYESSIPTPHIDFEKIALKSGVPSKNNTAKRIRLRWVAIGAASCLAIAASVIISTTVHTNTKEPVEGAVFFSTINEGDYHFESESVYVEGYSLEGVSITIELSEKEPTVGEFVIPKTDLNSRMLGVFSPCLLADASFVFEKATSPNAFMYKAVNQNGSFYMTIKAEDDSRLGLQISNDHSIYCSAHFSEK
ncbi:MAG: hypothetical protein K6G74_04530 [Bacilli bacterium]|nr:hypothetical protein [Bacilli bacterium]